MPVILDPASDAMKTWLDPSRTEWSKELQSVLKPYEGELECYPVSKEVGKVGNNSPDFILPVNSKENKNNIANFFANAKKRDKAEMQATVEDEANSPETDTGLLEQKVVKDKDEDRTTQDNEWTEDNAPVPVPGVKRGRPSSEAGEIGEDTKRLKTTPSPEKSPQNAPETHPGHTPVTSRKQTRSSTHNPTPSKKKTPNKAAEGSKPITSFFKK